ncbi:MAG: flavin reductase family protein [Candidatus Methanoperedens sp.]|nr:flavin reductase family protein [Candidatus Methanoperedens sp.]CAG1003339.1 flavin reductase [Methanosarcinales archaeon]
MKKKLEALNCLYPMPTVLVGTVVNGRPNFTTIAHVGIMNVGKQNYISISSWKGHYSNIGIKEKGMFSINIPSEDMVEETDYCGIFSGKDTDKSTIFEIFYGEMKAAPMISQALINMECKLYKTIDFPAHDLFIGEIIETYCDEKVLTDNAVDLSKVKPVLFDMHRKQYWKLGEPLAKCWDIGRGLKKGDMQNH